MKTNGCQMCKYYTVPGWIINAWQIVPCFECNHGNKQRLPKPRNLAETVEGQAAHEKRIRKEEREFRKAFTPNKYGEYA